MIIDRPSSVRVTYDIIGLDLNSGWRHKAGPPVKDARRPGQLRLLTAPPLSVPRSGSVLISPRRRQTIPTRSPLAHFVQKNSHQMLSSVPFSV